MTDTDPLDEFLDGDSPETVDLSAIPKDELAKHLLVAGVTRHLLREAAGVTEHSVRAGMTAVLAEGRVAHRRRNRGAFEQLGRGRRGGRGVNAAMTAAWDGP